jgi:nicotinate-nucleotide pyrophosphorylase (carboxylating)
MYIGLPPGRLDDLVKTWLAEDVPSFDFAGVIVGTAPIRAEILGKAAGILAGRPFVDAIFAHLNCKVTWSLEDGQEVRPVCRVALVEGRACDVLLGERVALNLLARASGIATRAKRVCEIAAGIGFKGRIAGTRKTTPGFRLVEKYALLVGGCDAHRHDLSAMLMLKDNHIDAHGGSISDTVKAARALSGFTLKIEVECRRLEDALSALEGGADIVMLDNAEPAEACRWAKAIRAAHPRAIVEISGGIRESTLQLYAPLEGFSAIDVMSMGSLTQDLAHIDFSLKVLPS